MTDGVEEGRFVSHGFVWVDTILYKDPPHSCVHHVAVADGGVVEDVVLAHPLNLELWSLQQS